MIESFAPTRKLFSMPSCQVRHCVYRRASFGDAVEEFYGERPDDAHRADVDVNSTARVLVGTYPEAPFRPATEEGI